MISRKNSRNPSSGSTNPMFAATGSTMTAAISFLFSLNNFSTESLSLYSATNVFFVSSFGTPALSGTDVVNAPEPAFTSKLSECP